MLYSLFRLLHFGALILFAGALIIENMAIKPSISGEDARNLARVDRACGLGALLTLVFGLVLWFWVGKPAVFYSQNPVFHAKLGLFALLLALAVYPALFFHHHRHAEHDDIAAPKAIRVLLRLELVLMLIIPLLAFLMARGIGSN